MYNCVFFFVSLLFAWIDDENNYNHDNNDKEEEGEGEVEGEGKFFGLTLIIETHNHQTMHKQTNRNKANVRKN